MKRWIFFGIIIVLSGILVYSGSIYNTIYDKLEMQEKEALTLIKDKTDINQIGNIDFYYGKSSYHVVTGKTKSGESAIAWLNDDTKKIIVQTADGGWTEEMVRHHVIEERSPSSIKSVRLGMEEEIPLWEVIYKDEDGRLNYYYVHFETGEFLKRYSLHKNVYKEEF